MIREDRRSDHPFELFEMPEPAFERLLVRRDRRERRQRVAATAIGIAVVATIALFVARSSVDRATDRDIGDDPVATPVVQVHTGLHVAYVPPEGWTSTASTRRALILDAGAGRSVIVAGDVWAGPPGCTAPGSGPSGRRCATGVEGIFDWMASRDTLRITRRLRPVGIGGFDAFRIELEPAPGVTHAQTVLQRSGPGGEPAPAVILTPGMRLLVHLVLTDREGTFAVSVVAPADAFDAFAGDAEQVLASLEFRG